MNPKILIFLHKVPRVFQEFVNATGKGETRTQICDLRIKSKPNFQHCKSLQGAQPLTLKSNAQALPQVTDVQ
jgi:hypothetical protein